MDSACDTPLLEWVAPFGNPRIKACSRLPKAFRSVPRPSSPLGAKASTRCPCFPRPPPATTTDPPHPICDRAGAPPTRAHVPAREGRREGCRCRRMIPATTTKRAVRARNGPHTHARCASCLQTEETKKNGRTRDLPMPVTHDAREGSLLLAPATGTSHHLTMSKQQGLPRAREPRVRERLVGLGRLERPTSRLSGVRSNQLSYRPEAQEDRTPASFDI